MRAITIDWMKVRDVLRVFMIGIMRLLAPDVSGSISAVDMAEMEKMKQKLIREKQRERLEGEAKRKNGKRFQCGGCVIWGL